MDDNVAPAPWKGLRLVAIVPCLNEEAAVGRVVTQLHEHVEGIEVYVYDNGSSDRTVEVALAAGAHVRQEAEKGKGNVLRRAFADIDSDVYLLIDGDDTYEVADAPEMIRTLLSGPYDHVLGIRNDISGGAYRQGHELGNRFFNTVTSFVFRAQVADMLSGYRVMSRRFVKSFPALSRQFEIETELTVHAISSRVSQVEVPVGFRDRPAGSASKLRTYHDGLRILGLVSRLLAGERPLLVTGLVAATLALTSLVLGMPLVVEFAQTGLVPRFPTAILASGLMILAGITLVLGLLLRVLAGGRREVKRLHYLGFPAPLWHEPGRRARHGEPPTQSQPRKAPRRASSADSGT